MGGSRSFPTAIIFYSNWVRFEDFSQSLRAPIPPRALRDFGGGPLLDRAVQRMKVQRANRQERNKTDKKETTQRITN